MKRLRVLALLYALVFFLADFSEYIVSPSSRIDGLDDWLPGTISIGTALLVAWVTTRATLSPGVILRVGLVFEVLGSFGIALTEFWGVYLDLEYRPEHLELAGLSFVAVWMMLYTVVVPTRPRTALLAASLSAATVPLAFWLSSTLGGTSIVLPPMAFFYGLVFPYMMVVLMAYVGARIIYKLGSDVVRARRMGSYELVEKLGQGGMGEVWRAEHHLLARPAAIKLIRPEALSDRHETEREEVLRRFAREARATSSLRSPHTVELYDFGVTEDRSFYYVMELLDGFDLAELVKRFGPLPAERVVFLLKQVCHSLEEAHRRGLVHRDIKPANILACRYGQETDFVKVLDFGLVKQREITGSDPEVSSANQVDGTPAFIAPEQATGGQVVDGRADLYALGCVAYWLLTGEFVFHAETAMQVMVMHVKESPIPPSARVELEIPPELDQLVLRCLAKDPAHRPQSAGELCEELAACEIGATWSRERALRWWELSKPQAEIS